MSEIKLLNLRIGLVVFLLAILFSMAIGFGSTYAHGETDDISNTSIGNEDGNRDALRARLQDIKHRGDEMRSSLEERQENTNARVEETNQKREEHQADVEEKREEMTEKLAERKEELEEKKKQRILAYANRILDRMDAAVTRLNRITNRVDSRIDKIEEEHGVDLANVRDLLETARTALDDAQADLVVIRDTIGDVLDTDDPKDSFTAVRDLLNEAKQSIKDAHKALVEAIKATKVALGLEDDNDGGGDDGANSTTTNATSTNSN